MTSTDFLFIYRELSRLVKASLEFAKWKWDSNHENLENTQQKTEIQRILNTKQTSKGTQKGIASAHFLY